MRSSKRPSSRVQADGTACERVGERISEYLDGELEPAIAWTVAVHLSRCPACARAAVGLAITVAALRRLSPVRSVILGWLAGPHPCGPTRRTGPWPS